MNVQELIDSLELDLERMRNIDPALRASMIARLDELRKLARCPPAPPPATVGVAA